MNIRRCSILAALVGAACFALRFMQQKTGFEAETGLAVRGNLFALILPTVLLLAAALCALAVGKRLLPCFLPSVLSLTSSRWKRKPFPRPLPLSASWP